MPAITQENIVGCQAPFSISEPEKEPRYASFWGLEINNRTLCKGRKTTDSKSGVAAMLPWV
jgi:hypothetical protein